jgi:L-ribulose-5-phosphate 3-epimerase
MSKSNLMNRLAVCSWSLRPVDSADLLEKVNSSGLHAIQLALDPVRTKPELWEKVGEEAAAADVAIVSGMFGARGEDYSTLESIRRTGGLVPDETWDENWANIQRNAEIAAELKIPLVTFHAGFLPHDESDPKFPRLIERIRTVADRFGKYGIDLGFETGQETADTLRLFLEKLDRPNVGVNFDPANMLIYNMGDPVESLRILLPFLKQCHIKDASRPTTPGTKGKEELAGTGEVDWRGFFSTLEEAGYEGHLVVEREKGDQRVADVRTAVGMVKSTIRA